MPATANSQALANMPAQIRARQKSLDNVRTKLAIQFSDQPSSAQRTNGEKGGENFKWRMDRLEGIFSTSSHFHLQEEKLLFALCRKVFFPRARQLKEF